MKRLSPEEIRAAADRAEARASGKTAEAARVDAALSEGELKTEIAKWGEVIRTAKIKVE